MHLRPQSLERRREARRAQKLVKRRQSLERQAAQRTALRPRDEHTGGYGDHTYPGP
jgi:hypothetical protein